MRSDYSGLIALFLWVMVIQSCAGPISSTQERHLAERQTEALERIARALETQTCEELPDAH